MTPALAEQIAHRLGPSAFLELDGRVYFARTAARPPAPTSAIAQLIQGIWERHSDQARRILRRRIHSTAEPTELCRGMVHVAAKRLTSGVVPRDHGLGTVLDALEFEEVLAPEPEPLTAGPGAEMEADPMALALRLAASVPREGPLHACARPVGAVLVSPDGRILGAAINRNARNRTLHAEVNLVQSYHRATGQALPPGCSIHVSLQSCRMCAGMIVSAASDPASIRVYFHDEDPGPQARHTALQRLGLERRWTGAGGDQ